MEVATKVVGSESKVRVGSTNFQKFSGTECFYMIYILIYFDAYIFKKSMQNVQLVEKKYGNTDLTTGLMMIIKASTILYTHNINHLAVRTCNIVVK
jgi:hypothetical protein